MSSISTGVKATSLKPHSPFGTFRRAWWVREDERLTAEEAASTLFRFFRSEHVADLQLIAKLARYLLLFYLVVVLLIAVDAVLTDTAHPSAEYAKAHIALFYFKVLAQYFGPAVPIYGAVVAWAYMTAETRLGVVDLFACEISTTCRVGTIFDIGKRYVAMYHSVKDKELPHSSESHESYFPIFDNNSRDLQSLQAQVVRHITEYYTYMKATRDLQRKLASINPAQIAKLSESALNSSFHSDEWHESLANIIYVLFLGYESARKSIDDLIEFQPTRAENAIIILLTELPCYSFLCEYHKKLKKDEVRFRRLQLREADYREIVPALIASVNDVHQGNEKYWALAQRTIPELMNRYNGMLETLEKCVAP
jgi:hypothetical protein